MRQNPERRAALVDAAIEVLAKEGARGLTFRSVDAEAAVPNGTASNYFGSRDDLLTQAGGRVYDRLQPDPATMALVWEGSRDRAKVTELMYEVVDRVSEYRSGYLALLELRLEATRRPALRAVLTRQIAADLQANIDLHLSSGLPGDVTTVELLYLALNWLIMDRLTLPDIFPEARIRALVSAIVDRALPAE